MAGKEIAAQKYVMRLSAEEREQLTSLIRSGKRSAQSLTKAHIVLKLDVSEGRDGWSEDKTEKGLDISGANIERRRRQLAEEGFEAVRPENTILTPPVLGILTAWRKQS
jgi:hypothetical protein